MKRLGLDVGSTTLKCVVLDEQNTIAYATYARHLSKILPQTAQLLREIAARFPGEAMAVSIAGSAGMGMAGEFSLPFVQEVYATRLAVSRLAPQTDVVIELGGEDAKILFLTDGLEVRMNGTCAGGTGAFIDQMAALMDVTPDGLDALAARHEKTYTIASRCGVFAKSDVQPLLNQGAKREDVAASIFCAVVNQTISGLAQGREIAGHVLYLGGPLTFLPRLRASFDNILGLHGHCPENSLYFVALGAAYAAGGQGFNLETLASQILDYTPKDRYAGCARLFSDETEYAAFRARHEQASAGIREIDIPHGEMFLGIDAGSTTVKLLLCDRSGNIFRPFYSSNHANPVPLVRQYLETLYRDFPDIHIGGCAVTGYGEDIVRCAFHADFGIVETIAHYTAAKKFRPDVDFILDIGGQDIKCFQIKNGAIDNIYLNEACSSGCGSFLQTFAAALGYDIESFSKLGLFAERPVDLGSRCTVFMNSSVKQAQKDGASVGCISAGLSISVVKNALYKVIRCADAAALGEHIVVQGGTFLNDAVLRAFEQEIGREVIRPRYAALMGAYGAALYALEHSAAQSRSSLLDMQALRSFRHETHAFTCSGCSNHCRLTLNTFGGKDRYIAGNRCDKPLHLPQAREKFNLFAYKNALLANYKENKHIPGRPTIGLPMGLNFYELLPFWYTFFDTLGFNIAVSPVSSRQLYLAGQATIPSDTVCYPAKLMHGHIQALLDQNVDAIFYPDMSYNIDEHLGDQHFNCPVVAYYPQVIRANMRALGQTALICDFISLHARRRFPARCKQILDRYFPPRPQKEIRRAAKAAYAAYDGYLAEVRRMGARYLKIAGEKKLPVIVLAGRPYHLDPEINHGIDELLCQLGAVVLSEDSVSAQVEKFPVSVRNQWTYHSRLYAAAKFVAGQGPDVNLVQLVSFGCGLDAITADETRSILEDAGKIYTQIKIDEISNMGAVKIRLRSLFCVAADKAEESAAPRTPSGQAPPESRVSTSIPAAMF